MPDKLFVGLGTGANSVFVSTYFQEASVTATRTPITPEKLSGRATDRSRVAKNVVNIESAVYSYIQAVRALGKTQVTTNEIARTLSLSPIDVINAIQKLSTKGVKIVNN